MITIDCPIFISQTSIFIMEIKIKKARLGKGGTVEATFTTPMVTKSRSKAKTNVIKTLRPLSPVSYPTLPTLPSRRNQTVSTGVILNRNSIPTCSVR